MSECFPCDRSKARLSSCRVYLRLCVDVLLSRLCTIVASPPRLQGLGGDKDDDCRRPPTRQSAENGDSGNRVPCVSVHFSSNAMKSPSSSQAFRSHMRALSRQRRDTPRLTLYLSSSNVKKADAWHKHSCACEILQPQRVPTCDTIRNESHAFAVDLPWEPSRRWFILITHSQYGYASPVRDQRSYIVFLPKQLSRSPENSIIGF